MISPRKNRIQNFKENIAHQLASDTLFKIVKQNISQHGQIYPCFTLQTIEQNINAEWNWHNLAINPYLTLDFLTKYADKFKENFWTAVIIYHMCPISGINKQDIYDLFPYIHNIGNLNNLNYEHYVFGLNSFWSYHTIRECNKDPYKFIEIVLNYGPFDRWLFELMDWVFNIYIYEKYIATYKIQQWWLKILSNPYHKVGKRFIEKQYDALVSGLSINC